MPGLACTPMVAVYTFSAPEGLTDPFVGLGFSVSPQMGVSDRWASVLWTR
jgi:hypothetical protein